MKKRTTVYAVLGVGTVVIIVLVLYFAGFRITYDPALLNDWNAISACASWASVIGSAFAIFVAIQIPSRIAEKQNKIALFEKRFAFYEALTRCVNFAKIIENSVVWDEKDVYFVSSCSNAFVEDDSTEMNDALKRRTLFQISTTLKQGRFLFDFDSDELVDPLVSHLIHVVSLNRNHKNFRGYYQNLLETATKVETQLLPKVRNELKLSSSFFEK